MIQDRRVATGWRRMGERNGIPLILAMLVAAAFSNALPEQFVFDSQPIIAHHSLLQPGSPWWLIPLRSYWDWSGIGQGLYRPATILSFWVERRVLGFEKPWTHAVVNIGLHYLVAVALWRVARHWTRSAIAAGAAAMLFAVHPVATEVVPNLVGRADLLATLGTLVAALAWEWPKTWRSIAVMCLAWGIALCGKESAIVLPAILILREMAKFETPLVSATAVANTVVRRNLGAWLALGAVGVVWFAARTAVIMNEPPYWVSPAENPLVFADPLTRLMTGIKLFALYLKLCVFPLHLSADHSFNDIPVVTSPFDAAYLASLAITIVYFVLMIMLWRRRSAAGLGLAVFIVALLPLLNIFFPIGTIMADRIAYLPLLGLCIAAGTAAASAGRAAMPLLGIRLGKAVVAAGLVAVIVLLGARTHQRNPVWHTSRSLWDQTIVDAPNSFKPHSVRLRQTISNPREAVIHADRVLAIVQPLPTWVYQQDLINAGAAYIDLGYEHIGASGLNEEAARYLTRGAELSTEALRTMVEDNPRTRSEADLIAWHSARGHSTEHVLKRRLAVMGNRAKALYTLGRFSEAILELETAVALDPGDPSMMAMLGRSLANAGRLQDAERALQRATAIEPENESYQNDLRRVQEVMRTRRAVEGREIPPETHAQ